MKADTIKKQNDQKVLKDTPERSIAKAVSWRILASLTTFMITFIIFARYTDKTFNEILETSFWVLFFDVIIKIIIYYFHERIWTNIKWGKHMKRNYWRRKAWKKMYREIHDQKKNATN